MMAFATERPDLESTTVDRDDLSVDRDVDRDRYGLEQRDREPRNRCDDQGSTDPRDVFMRGLELPRGGERELVRDRDCEYTLRRSETRDHARTSDSGIQVHAEAKGDGEREYCVSRVSQPSSHSARVVRGWREQA